MIEHAFAYQPSVVVPNVTAIAREMTSQSQMSMILGRVKKLSFMQVIQMGVRNIGNLPLLAKKEFAMGVGLLCELEILASKKKRKIWILHNQMADMALALKNTHMLTHFFSLASAYDFTPGVVTYNPERFIRFLSGFNSLPKNMILFCPKSSKTFDEFARATHLHITYI